MDTTRRRDDARQRTSPRRKAAGGLIVALVVTVLTGLVPMFTNPARAASVTPTFVAGNNSCAALGFEHEVKLNGVPANGSYVQLNPQLPVVTSGNPNLRPETSDSWNTSVVWEPAFQ